MLAKKVLYDGKNEVLPERIPLRAGPLSLFYEQGDLRYIRLGKVEVLRRVYVAVRDRNWGTVSPRPANLHMSLHTDSFYISFEVENVHAEIDFAWKGEIIGEAQGKITFKMTGVARSTFLSNRIGFCVLHPATCAGATAQVGHADGTIESGSFPELICPDQPVMPFAELRWLSHQVVPGVWAEVRFEGDVFEMEDQRNWTDASFKTFCPPLRLPYPARIEASTRIEQAVILTLREDQSTPAKAAASWYLTEPQPVTFSLQEGQTLPVPRLGLGVASHGEPLTATERSRLKALSLDHLRVDLNLAEDDFPDLLRRAAAEAEAIGVSLEAALLLGEYPSEGLERLRRAVESSQAPIKTWLVYPLKEHFWGDSPTRRALEAARQHLGGLVPGARFAAGTNNDLIFMLRTPPPLDLVDLVTFAINPQVHAFDNASLVETLSVQGVAVRTARRLAASKPVMVSPVTLKPRFNPYATGSAPQLAAGELPPQVDVRQMSLLGAGWTAGSLKYLSESGAESITYYETSGWRGVMETEQGSPLPEVFQSIPASVFPLYHVLADFGDCRGGEVILSCSSDPLRVEGISLRKSRERRLILANLTSEPQQVLIRGLGGQARVRLLDETSAEEALFAPERFRLRAGAEMQAEGGNLLLTLLPYAVARVDG